MKKLGSYIVYIVFLGLIVYWGVKYEEELGVLDNPFPLMIFITVFPCNWCSYCHSRISIKFYESRVLECQLV